jgi:hypothetical protein
VVVGVLSEETFRADNQYGGVMSHLSVCEPMARRLFEGAMRIRMPFLIAPEAPAEQQHQPKKKAAFPRARKANKNAGAAPVVVEPEDDVEIIQDDDADDSAVTQVRLHRTSCAHLAPCGSVLGLETDSSCHKMSSELI